MRTFSFDIFDALIRSSKFEKPPDEKNWTKTQITAPDQVLLNAEPSDSKVGCVLLWSKPSGKISIGSLQRATMSWLGSRGLVVSENLANTLIAFATHLATEFGGASGFFDELDRLVRQAVVKHVVIVSDFRTTAVQSCEFRGFNYGPLRVDALCKHFRHIGSEAFAQDLVSHSGKLALESPALHRSIIDIPTLCLRKKEVIDPGTLYLLLENYFQEFSRSHLRLMWNDVETATLIPNALQGGNISLLQIDSLPGMPRYTGYHGFGVDHKHGWVGRQHQQPEFRLPTPRLLDEIIGDLSRLFDLSQVQSTSLMPLVTSIARSISRGWSHAYNGRVDEAFLFMVISLEQVFSSKVATSQHLARRTAVVWHQELGRPFDEMRRLVADLYDNRSRIVHDGESPEFESFLELQEIATSALKAILRFAGKGACPKSGENADSHARWLKMIDFIASAIEAGQSVPEETLRECGIEQRHKQAFL